MPPKVRQSPIDTNPNCASRSSLYRAKGLWVDHQAKLGRIPDTTPMLAWHALIARQRKPSGKGIVNRDASVTVFTLLL